MPMLRKMLHRSIIIIFPAVEGPARDAHLKMGRRRIGQAAFEPRDSEGKESGIYKATRNTIAFPFVIDARVSFLHFRVQ